ncbi:hypothetical protein [Bacillus halotolerans]|uniref:hypothetical protein n=1 Tax=Bacillus halotolerans TaxID=260554 RepID=UPI002DBEC87A|nr:hypothetical protein [Bacillus halotolerans]MEC1406675.1 hypothetical protein [Bacillus halotolerans]
MKLLSLDINQTFLMNLREKLEGNGFTADDFKISTSTTLNKNFLDELTLQITYIYHNDYCFSFILNPDGEMKDLEISPGKLLSREKINGTFSYGTLTREITTWVKNLRKEMRNSVVGRQIKETQEKIEEIEKILEEKFEEVSESYFTKAEGQKLKDKLDELEEKYSSAFDKSEELESELKAEKKKLHQEIELLKDQVQYLTKKKWATALMVKLVNWCARNPQAAKQIGQSAVKTLLPKEIEDSLPTNLLPPTDENN